MLEAFGTPAPRRRPEPWRRLLAASRGPARTAGRGAGGARGQAGLGIGPGKARPRRGPRRLRDRPAGPPRAGRALRAASRHPASADPLSSPVEGWVVFFFFFFDGRRHLFDVSTPRAGRARSPRPVWSDVSTIARARSSPDNTSSRSSTCSSRRLHPAGIQHYHGSVVIVTLTDMGRNALASMQMQQQLIQRRFKTIKRYDVSNAADVLAAIRTALITDERATVGREILEECRRGGRASRQDSSISSGCHVASSAGRAHHVEAIVEPTTQRVDRRPARRATRRSRARARLRSRPRWKRCSVDSAPETSPASTTPTRCAGWRRRAHRRPSLAGRALLACRRRTSASSSSIEYFDKIFCCNVWLFWKEPVAVLDRLRLHLSPGGTVAITHLPRHTSTTRDTALAAGASIAAQLAQAGYRDVRREILELEPVPAVCVLATTG